MAEEFLTKKMIDENQLFKPKLNWDGLHKMPTLNFAEMYYSVEDVKRNYLVKTSLDDNQLVVETDDIQAVDTIEWNLTIKAPQLFHETKKIKSVRIRGNLGTIYYSFSKDDINTSSSIDFIGFNFYELTNNKFEFDPIFVLDAGTSGDLSGFVATEVNPDITLTYKFDDDSIVEYTSDQILIRKVKNEIIITPNVVIIGPPTGGGGDDDDDDESTLVDIYLRYNFSRLNGTYHSPSFMPVLYNTTMEIIGCGKVPFGEVMPTMINATSASIDRIMGKMDPRQALYLWNEYQNCGSAFKDLQLSPNKTVMLKNGLTSSPQYTVYPIYDSTTNRYVITLFIEAISDLPGIIT